MLGLQKKMTEFPKDIADYAKDGRLTAEPDGKHYDWSAVIEKFKQLDRKLTEEEIEQFRIK